MFIGENVLYLYYLQHTVHKYLVYLEFRKRYCILYKYLQYPVTTKWWHHPKVVTCRKQIIYPYIKALNVAWKIFSTVKIQVLLNIRILSENIRHLAGKIYKLSEGIGTLIPFKVVSLRLHTLRSLPLPKTFLGGFF